MTRQGIQPPLSNEPRPLSRPPPPPPPAGQGSDTAYLAAINKTHGSGAHARLGVAPAKLRRECFVVIHSAAHVTYDALGSAFVERNRDRLDAAAERLLEVTSDDMAHQDCLSDQRRGTVVCMAAAARGE